VTICGTILHSGHVSVVVMVTTAVVVVVHLGVVVMVTVAERRSRNHVVGGVKVAEWKFHDFVGLDPAAIVILEPLEMYDLRSAYAVAHSSTMPHHK